MEDDCGERAQSAQPAGPQLALNEAAAVLADGGWRLVQALSVG